jgi:hypothetical protein
MFLLCSSRSPCCGDGPPEIVGDQFRAEAASARAASARSAARRADAHLLAEQIVAHLARFWFRFSRNPAQPDTPHGRADDGDRTPG